MSFLFSKKRKEERQRVGLSIKPVFYKTLIRFPFWAFFSRFRLENWKWTKISIISKRKIEDETRNDIYDTHKITRAQIQSIKIGEKKLMSCESNVLRISYSQCVYVCILLYRLINLTIFSRKKKRKIKFTATHQPVCTLQYCTARFGLVRFGSALSFGKYITDKIFIYHKFPFTFNVIWVSVCLCLCICS